MIRSTASILLLLAPGALSWGTLGHATVAFVAQNYVLDDTKAWAQKILGIKNDTYLASVASWADSYRREPGGEFSAPFHYIDAEDEPPKTCNVDYQRDCAAEGCIVSAIHNYTSRVVDESLNIEQRSMALKWLVHFLGDIHQPLHNEALAVGGNEIDVTFDGEQTNLHAAWDTSLPEKLVGGNDLGDAKAWTLNLTKAIDAGVWKDDKAAWLSNMYLNDSIASAMVWTRDANSLVCSTVLPDGVEPLETEDLGNRYFASVIDAVELQIAKAGYRLAAWLNLLATGDIGLEVAHNGSVHILPVSLIPRGVRNQHSAAKLARREFGFDCRHN